MLNRIIGALTGPSPEEVRETYRRAENPCPNCKSDDYWYQTQKFSLTMHRCLNCGSEGMGPGFDTVKGGKDE